MILRKFVSGRFVHVAVLQVVVVVVGSCCVLVELDVVVRCPFLVMVLAVVVRGLYPAVLVVVCLVLLLVLYSV